MFYKYNINYYNGVVDKETTDIGLVYASSYIKAMEAIMDDYNNNIGINSIILSEVLMNGEGACITKTEIDGAFKDM